MESSFNEAAERIKEANDVSNSDLLVIYGLFKQAKVGNVNTSRPGIFDPKGRAKWDAWKSREDMDKETAMAAYVGEVSRILVSC